MKNKKYISSFIIIFYLIFSLFSSEVLGISNLYNNKATPSKEIILGSFSTPILSKDKNRLNNIYIAVKCINGYTLKPGKIFSFNKVVGKRKIKKGYKPANAIVNKGFKKFIGGGICQVSTTLYNAAEKSKLKIIEQHPHSKDVGYVKKGKDATVLYNTLDLKFKNTRPYPIKIRATVKNNRIYVWLVKSK